MLTQSVLSHADAMRILNAVLAGIKERGVTAAVAVADDHGELLAFARTDGCLLAPIVIAQNKAFTAARERRPSRVVGDSARAGNWQFTNFGDPRYTGFGGGVPIVVAGRVVGGVGVSGLTDAEDEELALIGAAVVAG